MLKALLFPTIDPQQSHRLSRWMLATGASAMVVVLLFAAHLLSVLPLHAFAYAAAAIVFFVIAFYVLFRSGLNRHFQDPSLTLPQILCSTLVILYVLYESPASHGVLALIYMVSFLFGVFRLSTRQLLALTAFVAVSYAAIIGWQWQIGSNPPEHHRKVLNWLVLTCVLTFFSVMGGYISRLRKNVEVARAGLEKALMRIEYLAARDELTGVLNRRSLIDILDQQKRRADRYKTTFSTLMLDIDFFKRVNDTHGHHAGDVVLKSFARAATTCLRTSDAFGRYGGEEFLVILDQTPLDKVAVLAERFCECARQLNFDELASGIRISISIGGAEYRRSENWKDTVARADNALYTAKRAGRDRYVLEAAASIAEDSRMTFPHV
jgi:diguanylate cyclase